METLVCNQERSSETCVKRTLIYWGGGGRGWGTMKRCQSVSCRFLSSRKFSLFVFHSQKAAHLLHYSTHEMDVIPFSQIENSRYSFSIIFLHPSSQRVKGLFHPSLNRRDYPHKGERIGPPSAMTWLDKIGHVERVQHRPPLSLINVFLQSSRKQ